jgi:hypothetical protein
MMEAVITSETSVSFYQTTRRNIPEGSHSRRREKLKSHTPPSSHNILKMEQSQLLYDGDSPTGQCAWGGEESGTIV